MSSSPFLLLYPLITLSLPLISLSLSLLFHSTNSNILVKMVNNLNPKRIPRQRLTTVNEVVHSELFQRPDCRRVLLPTFISQIRQLLAAGEEVSPAWLCLLIPFSFSLYFQRRNENLSVITRPQILPRCPNKQHIMSLVM